MRILFALLPLLLVALLCLSDVTAAETEWPEFRGAKGDGIAFSSNPPTVLDDQSRWKWQADIEGIGWSSPVYAGDKIWITTSIVQDAAPEIKAKLKAQVADPDNKDFVAAIELKAVAIDAATGRIVFNRSLTKVDSPDSIHPLNTFASPTPAIHNGRVYCHFGTYGTWCLDDQSGEILWHSQLQLQHSVGPGSSPAVIDNKLILACDGIDKQFVAALDLDDGHEVWRTSRPPLRTSEPESFKSYGTPTAVKVNGTIQAVVPGAQWVCGYDPETGREIWRIDHGDGFSLCGRPVVAGNLVIFSTGYTRPEMVAVRYDGSGDVTASHLVWRVSKGAPSKPSPIVVDDALYMVSDVGVLSKLQVADGSLIWQKRLSGNYSASPLLAGGRLYFATHDGIIFVLNTSAEFEVVSENELPSRILASPTVIDDDLLVRTEHKLIRIGH